MSSEEPPSTPRRQKPRRWIACPIEEQYLPDNRKVGKQLRKVASATDRSKYKKTDREKKETAPASEIENKDKLLRGRVLAITPQDIKVDIEGTLFQCVLRGIFKKDKDRIKNLITVGDFVLVEPQPNRTEGTIVHIEARTSTLSRTDHFQRRKEQLLAANIDQVLITTSILTPPLKPALIDRYLIASYKGKMAPIIVLNKIDLLNTAKEEELAFYHLFMSTYAALGIPLIAVSAYTGEGMEQLYEVMKNKSSVFSGQSGTGKSSLINAATHMKLRVGEIVSKTNKGAHTTTAAQLIVLPFGGWCIDTPGIRSFGVWDLAKEEVLGYFPEILHKGRECKYPSCRHINEPECAVKRAVEAKEISSLRYESYQKLISEDTWETV